MAQLSPEQSRKLFLKLPPEIREMASADETAELIHKILEENELDKEKGDEVSELLRDVLFGLLPPEELASALEQRVKLKKDLAKKIFYELNRLVFFPIKDSLNQLYRGAELTPANGEEVGEGPNEKPNKTNGQSDTYRETIE